MNFCVYGAASHEVAPQYVKATEELGSVLAKRGHTVIFGGGSGGMMGAVARGAYAENGKIIGIAPKFFNESGVFFEHCTEFFFTDTMRERKQLMEDKSDGFIVTPGGIGTFDEFFEILTLRSLGRHNKPIAILNVNGYYDEFKALFSKAIAGNFMKPAVKELCGFFNDSEQLVQYMETYKGEKIDFHNMKSV